MDYRDWHVGMKVVCVVGDQATVVEGHVYTIASIGEGGFSEVMGLSSVSVMLFEAVPPKGTFGFHPGRFRPTQPRKTDISIFTSLLTKAPTPEKEPA